jgi:cyanate permease
MAVLFVYLYLGSAVCAMLGVLGMAMSRGDRPGFWIVGAGFAWPIIWPVALVLCFHPFREGD